MSDTLAAVITFLLGQAGPDHGRRSSTGEPGMPHRQRRSARRARRLDRMFIRLGRPDGDPAPGPRTMSMDRAWPSRNEAVTCCPQVRADLRQRAPRHRGPTDHAGDDRPSRRSEGPTGAVGRAYEGRWAGPMGPRAGLSEQDANPMVYTITGASGVGLPALREVNKWTDPCDS
jgi:hypothetical protein